MGKAWQKGWKALCGHWVCASSYGKGRGWVNASFVYKERILGRRVCPCKEAFLMLPRFFWAAILCLRNSPYGVVTHSLLHPPDGSLEVGNFPIAYSVAIYVMFLISQVREAQPNCLSRCISNLNPSGLSFH